MIGLTQQLLEPGLKAAMARDLDGSFQTARRINVNNRSLILNGAIGHTDRFDFYRINLTHRSGLALTLSQMQANADVALFNADKQMIQQSNNPRKLNEAIATPIGPGTYYIRIKPYSKQNSTRYTLSLFCRKLINPSGLSSNNSTVTSSSDSQNPITGGNGGSLIITSTTIAEINEIATSGRKSKIFRKLRRIWQNLFDQWEEETESS